MGKGRKQRQPASQGPQKKIVIHHQIVKNGETKQFLADRVEWTEDAGMLEGKKTNHQQQQAKAEKK